MFATEGESATLSATVSLNPDLANLQPDAQWYRDGKATVNDTRGAGPA